MLLEDVQIIHDKEQEKFAVIPYEDYLAIKDLLSSKKQLADYINNLFLKERNGEGEQAGVNFLTSIAGSIDSGAEDTSAKVKEIVTEYLEYKHRD